MTPPTDFDVAEAKGAERDAAEPDRPAEPDQQPDRPAEPALGPREEQILAFERRWWRRPGAKEQAIRDTFELSPTRYYQLLNRLLDEPAALVHDPVLVSRLRRLRASQARFPGGVHNPRRS